MSKMNSLQDDELRNVFIRPPHLEPKHPFFSSPYVRCISRRAFGPRKPKWYRKLKITQLCFFQTLIDCVEDGRQGFFKFNKFLKALQNLDSTITASEVLNIIHEANSNEYEELDFGRFLFLLAYNDPAADSVKDEENASPKKKTTQRQSLILSAIANYVLIGNLKDIEEYYYNSTRIKYTILHYHLIASKLYGLSESEMEKEQIKASSLMKQLDWFTYGELIYSPYAEPVPIVRSFVKGKVYEEWKKSKYALPIVALEKSVSRPLIPPDVKRELDKDTKDASYKSDAIIRAIHEKRISIPEVRLEKKKIKQMRENFTPQLKDYSMKITSEAKKQFRTRLKKTAVLYGKKNIVSVLRQGFPTDKDRDTFIKVYRRYFPLK